MKDETLASLHDARQASQAVKTFVKGRSFAEYASDELLRSAVERKFEIMGEALNRVRRSAPPVLEQIRDHREIISFRNILVHGYDAIDNRIVWGVIAEDLDGLIEDLDRLLD
ncbi:MAG: DUF86 domain-containing protein [Victivallales bacterium]|jgi:uncharacterized protein with HEPN domain|nr:DUF86 domain-containing protein [Victivallales bacterium]MBT7161793.1 DUF86 domain-containing protein [Victivallales bacterium]MBT7304683.1 DUF86 domain-containing protein [Victivallales bacterium]